MTSIIGDVGIIHTEDPSCGIKEKKLMARDKNSDLRVIKTKKAIRDAFADMICEMDYNEITIKELTERAMINRKTFYLHYETLDDLLEELQQDIVDSFTSQSISYKSMADIKQIIRYFYEYAVKMPKLHERLLCSGSYEHIGNRINEQIMAYRAEQYRGSFSRNIYEDNLVFAYFSPITTILYRQWVKDGKKMPLEDLITTATRLVCGGLGEYVKS